LKPPPLGRARPTTTRGPGGRLVPGIATNLGHKKLSETNHASEDCETTDRVECIGCLFGEPMGEGPGGRAGVDAEVGGRAGGERCKQMGDGGDDLSLDGYSELLKNTLAHSGATKQPCQTSHAEVKQKKSQREAVIMKPDGVPRQRPPPGFCPTAGRGAGGRATR